MMTQEEAMNMSNEQAVQILIPMRNMMCDQSGCPISDAVFALDKAIESLSADVAPVRHGRLVDAGISASGHRLTMCTICKRKMREGIEIGIVSRYCPNCGVRLDEEAEK